MDRACRCRSKPLAPDRAILAARLGAELSDRHEILFAYVHGSYAEGLPHRDIDIAVCLRSEAVVGDAFDYSADLSIALTRLAGTVVDVHILNGAPAGFQHAVLQGEAILVHDDVALADFIERVSMEYLDFAALGRQHLQDLLAP
jgi:predicted nucleotidyltransferase